MSSFTTGMAACSPSLSVRVELPLDERMRSQASRVASRAWSHFSRELPRVFSQCSLSSDSAWPKLASGFLAAVSQPNWYAGL